MEPNKARFYQILTEFTFEDHERFNIGTYREKKLHILLKKYFEPDSRYHEIPTNGFIADIRRDNVITEIETSGFSGLGAKLSALLPEYRVRLVYPVAVKKTVSWIEPSTGDISPRRPSPKKASAYDAIFEMVRILPFVKNKNLTVLAPLLEIDEYRLLDGWSRDKKRGSHRYERMPVDLYDIVELKDDGDFLRYLPEGCRTDFSAADFAGNAHIPIDTARGVMKVLETRGLIERTGKRGNTILYAKNPAADP